MRRLALTVALLCLPAGVSAQVVPNGFPPGITPPVFGMPISAVNGSGVFSGQLLGPVGCENGAVAYAFAGDTDTGLCRPEPNELELVINTYPMINIQDQGTSRPAFFLQQDVTAFGADLEVLAFVGTGTAPWVIGTNANGSGTVLGLTIRGNATVADGWEYLASGSHFVPETDGTNDIGQVSGSVRRVRHAFLAGGIFSASQQATQASTAQVVQSLSSTATNDDPTEAVTQYRAATTDGVATAAATFTIATSTTTLIKCSVVARRTGGTAGAAEDSAAYDFAVVVKNTAGTVAEIAAETVTVFGESQAGWNVTAAPSGATEIISVTGATTNNVTWHLTCRTYAVNQ